jgi:hypothetical protein
MEKSHATGLSRAEDGAMTRLGIPKFASEAEEADWLYEHREELGQEFLEAMREGTLHHGGPAAGSPGWNEPTDTGYDSVDGEDRFTSLGHTNRLRILKVTWTVRKGGAIRPITAVDAPKKIAKAYLRAKVGE